MFLCFTDLRTSNRPKHFSSPVFWEIEDCEKNKSMGDATRIKRGGTMCSHILIAWWAPSRPSSIVSTQSWTLRDHLDLKPTIYTSSHSVISRWGGQKTRKTPYGSKGYKDRRGAAAGAAPSCPLDSIDIISFSTMIKRE
jgi:hypothetical protein